MNKLSQTERSFSIRNNGLSYFAGYSNSGAQVLMGIQAPELVMISFDESGDYLKASVREVPLKPLVSPQFPPKEADTDELLRALQDWQEEIEFRPAVISVKPFFLPDRWIGIKDLPSHYQEVLDHPEKYAPERLTQLQGDIRTWVTQGDFVLYWDEEFYLNSEGELESS